MDGAAEGRGDEEVAYAGLQSAVQLVSKGRLEQCLKILAEYKIWRWRFR
jgi:hypothetical protein